MVNRQVLTLGEFTTRRDKAFPKAPAELAGFYGMPGGKGLRSI